VAQETAALEERLQHLSDSLTVRQARLDAALAACKELAARNTEAHDAGLDTAVQVPVHIAYANEMLSLRLEYGAPARRSEREDSCCGGWP